MKNLDCALIDTIEDFGWNGDSFKIEKTLSQKIRKAMVYYDQSKSNGHRNVDAC